VYYKIFSTQTHCLAWIHAISWFRSTLKHLFFSKSMRCCTSVDFFTVTFCSLFRVGNWQLTRKTLISSQRNIRLLNDSTDSRVMRDSLSGHRTGSDGVWFGVRRRRGRVRASLLISSQRLRSVVLILFTTWYFYMYRDWASDRGRWTYSPERASRRSVSCMRTQYLHKCRECRVNFSHDWYHSYVSNWAS
jgi:hypothetical protein